MTLSEKLLERIDKLFYDIDVDHSGEVDLDELKEYFGEAAEPFLEQLDSIEVDATVSHAEWRAFFDSYLRPGMGGAHAAERTVDSLERTVESARQLRAEVERYAAHERRAERDEAAAAAAGGAPKRVSLSEATARAGQSFVGELPVLNLASTQGRIPTVGALGSARASGRLRSARHDAALDTAEALETRIDGAFHKLDADGSGDLDIGELRAFFGDEADEMMAELDSIERDGSISLEEWRAFFDTYRRIDGARHVRRATASAVRSIEATIELRSEMEAIDDTVALMSARLERDDAAKRARDAAETAAREAKARADVIRQTEEAAERRRAAAVASAPALPPHACTSPFRAFMRELDDGLGAMEREFDDLEARPSARLGAASDGPAARAHPARRGSAERVAVAAAAKAAGSGTVAATAAAAALALVSSPKVRGLRLSASPVGVGVCARAFVSRGA